MTIEGSLEAREIQLRSVEVNNRKLFRSFHTAHVYGDSMYSVAGINEHDTGTSEVWQLNLRNIKGVM